MKNKCAGFGADSTWHRRSRRRLCLFSCRSVRETGETPPYRWCLILSVCGYIRSGAVSVAGRSEKKEMLAPKLTSESRRGGHNTLWRSSNRSYLTAFVYPNPNSPDAGVQTRCFFNPHNDLRRYCPRQIKRGIQQQSPEVYSAPALPIGDPTTLPSFASGVVRIVSPTF